MKHFKYLAFAAAALLASLALVACGGGDDDAAATTESAETETMEMPAETGGTAGVAIESPATDLRVTLNRLLGEHALLAVVATQKGYDGDADFEAAAAALDENSVELSEAIASVYGEEAGQQFLDGDLLWRDHIGFFVDYTVALKGNDEAGKQKAVDNLMGYSEAFSNFLAEATGVPQDALREGLGEHITQLKGQIDAYAAGNYEEAYGFAREAYHHMGMTGDVLAGAITEQNAADFDQAGVTAPAADLRIALNRLLGEHALLAVFATQKGFAGKADFEAAAGALDENSVELSEAIASVYGEEAGTQFLDGELLWRDHIGFFVDYTVALAGNDAAGQEEAVGNLMGYGEAFSSFLAEATGAPQADLRDGLEQHVMQLKGQIDAFSQENYEEAYSLTREAYHHMGMTGDALAAAIVQQSPGDFAG